MRMRKQSRRTPDKVRVGVTVFCGISLCLMLAATATTSWSYLSTGERHGLWKTCTVSSCDGRQWKNTPPWMFACQALFIVAQILTFVAFIGSILLVLKPHITLWYLAIATVIPALLMFVGLGIFNRQAPGHRDYSFYLGALGSGFLFAVAISATMNHYQIKKMIKKRGIEAAESVEAKLNAPGRDIA